MSDAVEDRVAAEAATASCPSFTTEEGATAWLSVVASTPQHLVLALSGTVSAYLEFVFEQIHALYLEATSRGLAVPLALSVVFCLALVLLLARSIWNRLWGTDTVKAVKEFVVPGKGPRFRKRDRLVFLSRRALRNAKAVGSYIRGGQGRKRRDMAKLVKRVFRHGGSPDAQSQMLRPDLPEGYLEEEEALRDHLEDGGQDHIIPVALVLVLRNLRVFGHFENTMLLELVRSIEYVTLRPGECLFRVGDPDSNMYVVESGAVRVYCEDQQQQHPQQQQRDPSRQQQLELKSVRPGEAIVSLLSFLDHLGGKREAYKTVSAQATRDSKVIKISFDSFNAAFDKFPDNLARVVQVIMVRLQRVTFLALHQYMGLGTELMSEQPRGGGGLQHLEQQQELPSSSSQRTSPQPSGSTSPKRVATSRQKHFSSEEQLRMDALATFKTLLGLPDDDLSEEERDLLSSSLEIVRYSKGEIVVHEETTDRNCLFLVVDGGVIVSQKATETQGEGPASADYVEMHKALPGGMLGQLQVLTCEPSFFTYRASDDGPVTLAMLSGFTVSRLVAAHPFVALRLALSVIENLSTYVRSIDFALEWTLVESGKALFRQGGQADSVYVVLSGRLRSVIAHEHSRKREMVAEYGRGELTGIVETLMRTPRSTTVLAVRDTEVAKLPAGLIDFIKLRFPKVLMTLIRLLGEKLQQSWERPAELRHLAHSISVTGSSTAPSSSTASQPLSAMSNLSTVAVFPLSSTLSAGPFTMELLHALNRGGYTGGGEPSIRLTKDLVKEQLGADAFDKSSDFRLSAWLAQQEDKHRIVLYECERDMTPWTRLAVRHADVIFVLVDPTDSGSRSVTALEDSLENYARRTRKEVMFLHGEDVRYPKHTSLWLKDRGWINAHYHLRCPKRIFLKRSEKKVQTVYAKLLAGPPPDVHSDFSRMARCVTGNTVGLVLGGGGARGCSHVGMIKAILEAGIPIDSVAGVSIGAFIGGLWCQERSVTEVTQKARKFSHKMMQLWRQVVDLTYPYTAYFSGRGFNALLEEAFEARDIMDLWLPYFTVTTDITESAMRIHDYGSLWRYVRSSMSLAGYMPPLCDPHDGHLLLDGGYVNNLPADIMRMRGAKHILAIDVGSQDEADFTNYGDFLSGFQVLWSRWNPFSSSMFVPNHADVQTRLAYVSCVGKLESVKAADYCDYIRPPIDRYGTLQFGSFDEIRDVGYYHGKTYFSGLSKAGLMKQFLSPGAAPSHHQHFSSSATADNRPYFNLSKALRRESLENLSSPSSPTSMDNPQMALMLGQRINAHAQHARNLTELAELVCAGPSASSNAAVTAAASSHPPLVPTASQDESLLSDEDDEDSAAASAPAPAGAEGFTASAAADSEDVEDDDEDIDSDKLISDEEDDAESGFLSQI